MLTTLILLAFLPLLAILLLLVILIPPTFPTLPDDNIKKRMRLVAYAIVNVPWTVVGVAPNYAVHNEEKPKPFMTYVMMGYLSYHQQDHLVHLLVVTKDTDKEQGRFQRYHHPSCSSRSKLPTIQTLSLIITLALHLSTRYL